MSLQRKKIPEHLFEEAEAGRFEAALDFVRSGGDINSRSREAGWTLLHFAASEGDEEIIRACLDLGADINARDECQRTPLHWAAWCGEADSVQILIQEGADVMARDDGGRNETPLDYALSELNSDKNNFSRIITMLRRAIATQNAARTKNILALRRRGCHLG